MKSNRPTAKRPQPVKRRTEPGGPRPPSGFDRRPGPFEVAPWRNRFTVVRGIVPNENDMNDSQKRQNVLTLFRRLVTEIISHPENLVIDAKQHTQSMVLTVQAHAADTSRLIGEGASNYKALVTMATALGGRAGMRVSVPPIREPVIGERDRYKFTPNPEWPRTRIMDLLSDTARAVFADPDAIEIKPFDDDGTVSTTVELWVARNERTTLVHPVGEALRTLFDAIGKANGRLIYLDVIPKKEVEGPQPATAGGRFTKEVRR